MKINSYAIQMESKHVFTQSYSRNESLRVVGNVPNELTRRADHRVNPTQLLIKDALKDYLDLSKEATEKLQQEVNSAKGSDGIKIEDVEKLDIPDKDKQKILLLARLIKAITGKDIKIILPEDIKLNPSALKLQLSKKSSPTQDVAAQGPDWAAQYNFSESYYESESLSFQTKGIINTSDGKQISIDLSLNMTRQFAYQNNISITAGNKALLDPLVINFDSPAASITQTKFAFDLDSDGSSEQLSTLTSGSGFLAIDKNGDGQINDGSELFGTKSGNGFADLLVYDTDYNNWLDENDSIFDKLRIWTVNEDGTKELFSLGEKGIGAIYLGNVGAAFQLTDAGNNVEAAAKSAGIFLKENGTAGTIQQVDYFV